MTNNPFDVLSPEQLNAAYIADNFVDVFTDFPKIMDFGNTFISGARGTGKSMLLRSLEPSVLLKLKKVDALNKLEFLGIHVPLRKAEFGVPELCRLEGYPAVVIGEHLLTMHICFRIFSALKDHASAFKQTDLSRLSTRFIELLDFSGMGCSNINISSNDSVSIVDSLARICEKEVMRTKQYYKRIPMAERPKPYDGALTTFLDVLVPLVEGLVSFPPFRSVPVFLMLDDADNLPVHLQKILNSWISTRSTHAICLKISTQLAYATYKTVDGRIIESPHDFSEINLSAIYTTNRDSYHKRVEQIVRRRLYLAGIDVTPDFFFPIDQAQEERLTTIRRQIEEEWISRPASQGASRVRDEVARKAVPRLMQELSGRAKSSHTFSYAGFESLVNLSSGVVRWFLEPASRMFDEMVSSGEKQFQSIPVALQDKIIDTWSREFVQKLSVVQIADSPEIGAGLIDEERDESLHARGHEPESYGRLKNLIDSLGLLFRQRILDSKASEQRLISIVLRGRPSLQLASVLALGVRLGYLQQADYAAKEALGTRQVRYILSRRLGPYYKLDISGYAAHLSVTADDLAIAMVNPVEFAKRRLKQGDSEQLGFDLENG